ncbi:PREDICTED: serine protease snake-like isoform X1 [Bactrocera latifrons]|nr:PREDICTED: serine protease snake-like isoform X1 [Bactrocera latifrons]
MQIFFLTGIILLLVVLFSSLVMDCYVYQSCLTKRNRLGSYVTRDVYRQMAKESQDICLGACNYNKTTQLICCAYRDVPADKRISQIQCDINHTRYQLIVHGKLAQRNEFPFMLIFLQGAIGWRDLVVVNRITYKCGGALIDRRYLLTAAHCLFHSNEPPIVVRPGGFNLTDAHAKDFEIDEIYIHPGFEYPSAYNDIAIIRLKEPYYAESFENTGPACTWALPLFAANVTAIGYGSTRFAGLASDSLMKTNLTILNNEECGKYYEQDDDLLYHGIIHSQLCANDTVGMSDTCQGDSGGPIIMYRTDDENEDYYYEMPYVVGITSFGNGCGSRVPGVYTRVASYIDWIEKIVY